MEVCKLKLNNFRNYKDLVINTGSGLNIIYGENGQGKTNIVEAIFLCAAGRSHRTSRDSEMIKQGELNFIVQMDYNKRNMISGTMIPHNIRIEYGNERRKKPFLNDIPLKRLSDLVGNFNAVMFSPEEISIIKGGPANRRHFIDIALCQISPVYMYNLQKYQKTIEHKNKLLKKLADKAQSGLKVISDELFIWNNFIAETGAFIMKSRKEYTEKLNKKAEDATIKISSEKENLSINYSPSINVKDNISAEALMKIIENNYMREIYQGTSLYGPHRDDWIIELCSKDIRVFGSQGQQRTATIALKIAEALVMEDETGQRPVIILDDIMSELDRNRQMQLTSILAERQVFATCTEKEVFKKSGYSSYNKMSFFEVKNGAIKCE